MRFSEITHMNFLFMVTQILSLYLSLALLLQEREMQVLPERGGNQIGAMMNRGSKGQNEVEGRKAGR